MADLSLIEVITIVSISRVELVLYSAVYVDSLALSPGSDITD